jgi:hypothetical protein
MVVCRAADVLDVARPQALLATGRPRELQLDLPQEVVLELVHSRRREQHAGIPRRHEHIARHAAMPFGDKEFEVLFAKFVSFHGSNFKTQITSEPGRPDPGAHASAGAIRGNQPSYRPPAKGTTATVRRFAFTMARAA